MNPENIKNSIQAIVDGLTPLAQKLQIPLEKIFSWAIKENYVNLISLIILGLVLSISIFLFYKFIKWGCAKNENGNSRFYYDDGFVVIGVFAGIILTIVFFIFLTFGIPKIISRAINPEYNALQDIVNIIKPQDCD